MATTWRNKKNYPLGVGSLNADINSSTLTIVLSSGQGANFPSATFTITIDEEIILIDSRSTDTLTANASGRGYDSTTAAAHAAAATVANYQIVKDFTDLETAVNTVENIIGGVNPIADDTYLKFGTDTDVKIGYDETTNDRLDFRDASNNVLAFLKDNGTDGIFGVNTIQVTSGTTATLYNTVATTVSAFGAATVLNIGNASGTNTILGKSVFSASAYDVLLVKRPQNTNGFGCGMVCQLNDSASNTHEYASILGVIVSNTNGSEQGGINFYTSTGGTAATSLAARMTLSNTGDLMVLGDATFHGGDIIAATATTWNVLNTVATTINFGAAASAAINIGNTAGPITFAGIVVGPATTTSRASFRAPHGTAPSAPVDGDIWTTTAGLYVRINGATVGPLS